MSKPSAYSLSAHNSLKQLAEKNASTGLIKKFDSDSDRVNRYTFDLGAFSLDLSKTHIDSTLVQAYTQIAKDIDFGSNRSQFLNGFPINATENRPVLHTLLRQDEAAFGEKLDPKVAKQAVDSRAAFKAQIIQINNRISRSDHPITDLIHIGIGGSSLGTQLVYEALKPLNSSLRVHFVSNIDAHQLLEVLAICKAQSTLVFGISKTFTTAETLKNVTSVLQWMQGLGVANPMSRLYAVTANPEAAHQFGVNVDHVVSFPTWVGGRYSVWSSVSITAALMMGEQRFDEFLQGAASIDKHFAETNPENNIPFLSACLDHYYCNYSGAKSRAIFAYDHRLRSLVPYLQQLETESNGKDRQRNGEPVDQLTSPVVWGGVGTDVQHSVFQMLHQGTSLIPSEFILIVKPDHKLTDHHSTLLANGIAQTAALLVGQDADDIRAVEPETEGNDLVLKAKTFSGNRPSTTFLLEQLSPFSLGALLAFYEHRTYCFGQLVNINSFDQMGVELGKRLANDVASSLEVDGDQSAFDPSTQSIIARIKGN